MNSNIDIDWRKYVDHIYLIDYTKSTNDRSLMTKELKRLGMYDIDLLTIFNNISTPFYDVLHESFNNSEENEFLKKNPFYQAGYGFYATMAHYFCIKQAYELGYDHIMVLENDMCFLRNKQYIENILESCRRLYDEYEIFVLDNSEILNRNSKDIQPSLNSYINLLSESNTIQEFYSNDRTYDLNMAGCNIYSREAMTKVIKYFESYTFSIIDEYGRIFDKCAYSFPPIGIQQTRIFWYDIDIAELYTIPKIDYKYILDEDCHVSQDIEATKDDVGQPTIFKTPNYLYNFLKNGYRYIKKYCIGYKNDEDFKYFEKLYNQYVLEQEVSFDDIDPDKLNIFILDKEKPNEALNSKNYKDVLKDVINSDIIDDWDDNTINKFYNLSDNKIKESYEYIIANCKGYENDEDFKLLKKWYNAKILGQNISFDDIDKDKLDIFKGEI